jgi:nucleoid DNA-binding protein
MKSLNKDQFIQILADKKGFTKSDARALLDGVIEIFEQSVKDETSISIRGFGHLKFQHLKERKITKGKYAGTVLPPAIRVTWKLSENIRFAGDGSND